jgi:hypothetical protein
MMHLGWFAFIPYPELLHITNLTSRPMKALIPISIHLH